MDLRNRHVPSRRVPGPTTESESETTNKIKTRQKQAKTEKKNTNKKKKTMPDLGIELGDDDAQRHERLGAQRQQQQKHRVWLAYAITSGICAAFNGVFAKLTTTKLTADLASGIAAFLGIPQHENVIQLLCRVVFFLLNLLFNGIMWTLFTSALKKSASATQVAVMNTSTNFLVTAFAGLIIFSEALPPMWWAGATLLVAGSVIAGRRDRQQGGEEEEEEEEQDKDEAELEFAAAAGEHRAPRRSLRNQPRGKPYRDEPSDDEDMPHLDRP